MSEDKIAWKPAAMSRIETDNESPPGFQSLVFVGIGMKSEMLEPTNPDNWLATISGLKSWGEVPSQDSYVEEIIHSDRGINLKLKDNDTYWLAEFFPWGNDGRLRSRISLATGKSDTPIGIFSWNNIYLISLRPVKSDELLILSPKPSIISILFSLHTIDSGIS